MAVTSSPYVGFRKDRRGVHGLWERFNAGLVASEEPHEPYQELLLAEWRRCTALGVDVAMNVGRRLAPDAFGQRLRRERLLVDTALPLVRDVGAFLGGVPGIIMLTDGTGTVLYIGGDDVVRERAATLSGIVEGSQWNEATAGTNGIGTAIALRRPVHVFATEHFCEGWHTWTCAGAPIFDADGTTVIGVVDFTTIETDFRDQALGLSVSLANSIQSRLALHRELERGKVLMAFGEAARRWPHDDLLALDHAGMPLAATPNERCRHLVEHWSARDVMPVVRETLAVTAPGGEAIGSVLVMARPVGYQRVFGDLAALDARGQLPVMTALRGEPPTAVPGTTQAPAVPRSASAAAAAAPRVTSFGDFVTADADTVRLLDDLRRIAAADVSVLLTGETGTGKELLARHLHACSPRASQPYVAVNCGAISESLMESAFFGYVRGAFSGADPRGRAGYFESAGEGTLFLDEVGELSTAMQVALLRVLEDGSFQRAGSCRAMRAVCRIVAATDGGLERRVADGGFRRDLYFRLEVVHRSVKPLRERPCDVTLLARRFAEAMRCKHGLASVRLTDAALTALCTYAWPGNVRELRNAIEAAVLCCHGVVELEHLPPKLLHGGSGEAVASGVEAPPCALGRPDGADRPGDSREDRADGLACVRAYERTIVIAALRKHRHVKRAADALGIARSTLYRKFGELAIKPSDYVGRGGARHGDDAPPPSTPTSR